MLRAGKCVVERKEQPVSRVFRVVVTSKSTGDHLRLVTSTIAIRVATEQKIRRLDDENPITPMRDRTRHHEPIKKNLCAVKHAVMICVSQHFDASERLTLAST